MKHVFVNGVDNGDYVELNYGNAHQLAQLLEVSYPALWRRLHETLLFEVDLEANILKVSKEDHPEDTESVQ